MFPKPTRLPIKNVQVPTPQSDIAQEMQILHIQGKQCYDRKQSGYSGQDKPIFQKKAKTTNKVVLRLECVEPNCRSKRTLATQRC
jgi:ribosomal protein L44E